MQIEQGQTSFLRTCSETLQGEGVSALLPFLTNIFYHHLVVFILDFVWCFISFLHQCCNDDESIACTDIYLDLFNPLWTFHRLTEYWYSSLSCFPCQSLTWKLLWLGAWLLQGSSFAGCRCHSVQCSVSFLLPDRRSFFCFFHLSGRLNHVWFLIKYVLYVKNRVFTITETLKQELGNRYEFMTESEKSFFAGSFAGG